MLFRLYAGSIKALFRLYAGSMQALCRLYSGSIQALLRLYSGIKAVLGTDAADALLGHMPCVAMCALAPDVC